MAERGPPSTAPEGPSPLGRVIGYGLIALGALWLLLGGGCTVLIVGYSLTDWKTAGPSMLGVLLIPLIVGIAPGAVMLWAGLAVLRGPRRKSEP